MTELTSYELEVLRKWRLTHPPCPECKAPGRYMSGSKDNADYKRFACAAGHKWSTGIKPKMGRPPLLHTFACGHPKSDENIYMSGKNRRCSTCRAEHQKNNNLKRLERRRLKAELRKKERAAQPFRCGHHKTVENTYVFGARTFCKHCRSVREAIRRRNVPKVSIGSGVIAGRITIPQYKY